MPKSPPSGRAYKHSSLSCGLVNIPVTVYSGTVSDHGISRNQFTTVTNADGSTEDHPVGNMSYDKLTGDPVPHSEIIKKINTEYGPVYVEDNEIEKLFDVQPDSLEVKEFQPQHLFHQGHYVPKSLYFIEPAKVAGKGGKKVPSPANNKALVTFLKAMREEGAIAVCEFTTRGNPQPAILLPDGSLWVVYHTDALREARPLPEIEISEGEVAMARQLLQILWSDQPKDLTDERSALIQNFADEKARAGDFGKPEADAEVEKPEETNTDFMALMAASVEAAKAKRAQA